MAPREAAVIYPILIGCTSLVFGLLALAVSPALARFATNGHWFLRDEQKPAYESKKRQTLRIMSICFVTVGGGLIVVGLLTGLVTGQWVWSSGT